MSLEPKKPIEEILEASARARRAEFGVEPRMPNPMRAQLQAEIARRNRAPAEGARGWRDLLWPRLALGTALVTALVSAAVIWSRFEAPSPQPTLQLAMNQPAPAAIDALKADAVPPIAGGSIAAPGIAAADGALQKFADVAIALADQDSLGETATGRAETEVQSSTDERARFVAKAKEVPAQPAIAAAEPTEQLRAAPPASAPAALAKNERADNANAQQQFSQTARGQALRSNVKLAANVLNNFQVEQEGSRIRLVDEDGSTYTGKLETVAQNTARGFTRPDPKSAAPSVASMAPSRAQVPPPSDEARSHFRATGFNARLKKQVVFEGNYIAAPTPQQQAAKDVKQNQQTPARIVGTVQIPGESPVEVDAEAVVH
jgi:hypothetical protein